jgi:hypothetical protein
MYIYTSLSIDEISSCGVAIIQKEILSWQEKLKNNRFITPI